MTPTPEPTSARTWSRKISSRLPSSDAPSRNKPQPVITHNPVRQRMSKNPGKAVARSASFCQNADGGLTVFTTTSKARTERKRTNASAGRRVRASPLAVPKSLARDGCDHGDEWRRRCWITGCVRCRRSSSRSEPRAGPAGTRGFRRLVWLRRRPGCRVRVVRIVRYARIRTPNPRRPYQRPGTPTQKCRIYVFDHRASRRPQMPSEGFIARFEGAIDFTPGALRRPAGGVEWREGADMTARRRR